MASLTSCTPGTTGNPFIPIANVQEAQAYTWLYYFFHFTDEKTGAQGHRGSSVVDLGFEPTFVCLPRPQSESTMLNAPPSTKQLHK